MSNMMGILLADSQRLQERRATPPLDKPASRADRIIAECDKARVRYRIENPTAPSPMIFGRQIGLLHIEVRRLCDEIDALKAELQTAVNEACNDYWIKGHGARVAKAYGIEAEGVTTPDAMDTVRLAHAAMTGKADTRQAIAQCARLYGQVQGVAL